MHLPPSSRGLSHRPQYSASHTHTPSTTTMAHRFIPPEHSRRCLILAFDGTGDQFDDDNSNLVQLVAMMRKTHEQQLVYYQTGIGTYTIPHIANPFKSKMRKIVDSMIGGSINTHVMGGYEFLMQNYRDGDKVCMFGFSRGAYIARALAGMLHKVGLLPAGNHQQVPFAYKMFISHNEKGWKQSVMFKRAFCRDIEIEFLGVWDTVQSVGVLPKRRLPFTASSNHIRYFRHAISLDERRVRFQPNFWLPGFPLNCPERHQLFHDKDATLLDAPLTASPPLTPSASTFGNGNGKKAKDCKHDEDKKKGKNKLRSMEQEFNNIQHSINRTLSTNEGYVEDMATYKTDVLEVWFTGCHADVGGGSVLNNTPNSLSRITLRWMVRQCFLANTGIMFDRTMMHEIGMDGDTLWPKVIPRPSMIESTEPFKPVVLTLEQSTDLTISSIGKLIPVATEEEEEVKDALSPIYDQLALSKFWWVLEFIPNKIKEHLEHGMRTFYTMNRGRGRRVPHIHVKEGIKVHRSVKLRMEAARRGHLFDVHGREATYVPRVKWDVEPEWVD